ncbi:hypothetical protein Pla108_26360 [Botrimarina colliarenosi]|uniref:PEP-CTERM protein-sorting domain-containing protein n=2 Tax=Botrimarina colliarenosi TaxID=2528001 RepID=A0A5C6ACP7_9BACT|nr:hypothetical protein Pla108_26360 [Botrimarina colliarenosi]
MPQMGGAQVTMMEAGMKHANIDFDGAMLSVHIDDSVATPALRELAQGDSFDPTAAWSVLEGSAYNFQYGWNPGSIWSPPAGLAVAIEPVSATPGLMVYDRSWVTSGMSFDEMSYDPIFTNGEPWMWSGRMTHNAYAVVNPTQVDYEATYRVYLADAVTGVEPTDSLGAPLYGSAMTTFRFVATPVPEPASALLGLIALAAATFYSGGHRA